MDTTSENPGAGSPAGASPRTGAAPRQLPLCRPAEGRMLAGVAAGIAHYLAVDVTAVRVVLAVLAVVGGVGIPLYLAGWLLIPEEGAEHSIASSFIQSGEVRWH